MDPVQILAGILGLSVLVIVHESGHYLAARAFGMRVTRFSIGFGPIIASWRPRNSHTTFQIGAILLFAYVMIDGMSPADEVDPNDKDAYPNKGVIARTIAIFAGPFANYLAASVIAFGLAVTHGWPDDQTPAEPMTVAHVIEDTPAHRAGIEPGDVIVEAAGKPIHNVTDLQEVTRPRAGEDTSYIVERDGKRIPLTITPDEREGEGVIGVHATTNYVVLPAGEAAVLAIELPVRITMLNLSAFGRLIRERTTEGITGPVGIGKIVAEEASKGLFSFFNVLIFISVALAVANLLPFPGLDGGRLAFLGYEAITRRRANERVEAAIHTVGLIFLLGVIVLVTFRDIWG